MGAKVQPSKPPSLRLAWMCVSLDSHKALAPLALPDVTRLQRDTDRDARERDRERHVGNTHTHTHTRKTLSKNRSGTMAKKMYLLPSWQKTRAFTSRREAMDFACAYSCAARCSPLTQREGDSPTEERLPRLVISGRKLHFSWPSAAILSRAFLRRAASRCRDCDRRSPSNSFSPISRGTHSQRESQSVGKSAFLCWVFSLPVRSRSRKVSFSTSLPSSRTVSLSQPIRVGWKVHSFSGASRESCSRLPVRARESRQKRRPRRQ